MPAEQSVTVGGLQYLTLQYLTVHYITKELVLPLRAAKKKKISHIALCISVLFCILYTEPACIWQVELELE